MAGDLKPLRIGLTGGIGSGKSTVAGSLVRLGAALVDADAISRELTMAGGAAIPAIVDAFGASVVDSDGALNRETMRRLVFADAAQRARLEAILHPLIGQESRRREQRALGAAIVFDIPLLTESSHWRSQVDRILVVDCEERTQAERVAQRPGWTLDAAWAVIRQQAARSARRGIADAVLHNEGLALTALHDAVATLWCCWGLPLREAR